jgi:ATP-binding cassette subfamily F protein 3
MVTHNELFLHALADRLIVFQEGNPVVYNDGYQHFLDNEGWHDEIATEQAAAADATGDNSCPRLTKKELRRRRSEVLTARTKVLKPIEDAIAQAEEDISQNEKLVEKYSHDLMEASGEKDGARIGELSRNLHHSQQIIDQRFETLEKLYAELDDKSEHFQEQLDRLAQDDQATNGA